MNRRKFLKFTAVSAVVVTLPVPYNAYAMPVTNNAALLSIVSSSMGRAEDMALEAFLPAVTNTEPEYEYGITEFSHDGTQYFTYNDLTATINIYGLSIPWMRDSYITKDTHTMPAENTLYATTISDLIELRNKLRSIESILYKAKAISLRDIYRDKQYKIKNMVNGDYHGA